MPKTPTSSSSKRRPSSNTASNRKASTSAVTLNHAQVVSSSEDEIEDDDEDDEDQGEEYDVEALRDHRFVSKTGAYEFLVKWVGYDESENTWEPEDNITSPELLAAYWNEKPRATQKNKKQQYEQEQQQKTNGTRTKQKQKQKPKMTQRMSTTATREDLDDDEEEEDEDEEEMKEETVFVSSNRSRSKTEQDEADDREVEDDLMDEDSRDGEEEADEIDAETYLEREAEWHAKYDAMRTWEKVVESVKTLEKAPDGGYLVYIAFKDGPSLIYPLAVANHKCPQHMLAFYERHLKFTNPKRDMSKVSPSGKSKRR